MTTTTGRDRGPEPQQSEEQRREPTSLDHRYGEIGISAVAAALPYAGLTRKPAPTKTSQHQIDERFVEAVG
jgi:hypothetical protein